MTLKSVEQLISYLQYIEICLPMEKTPWSAYTNIKPTKSLVLGSHCQLAQLSSFFLYRKLSQQEEKSQLTEYLWMDLCQTLN